MMAAWQKAATPGPQHAQLAEHFAGTWDTKQTMWMDPSAPPMVETGKSVDTAVLGGRQIRTQFSSRSEEHTSELQSLMRISYAVFCLKQKKNRLKITQ